MQMIQALGQRRRMPMYGLGSINQGIDPGFLQMGGLFGGDPGFEFPNRDRPDALIGDPDWLLDPSNKPMKSFQSRASIPHNIVYNPNLGGLQSLKPGKER